MSEDIIVRLERVTKYFDQVRPVSLFKRERTRVNALKDVSFTLRRGEFAGPFSGKGSAPGKASVCAAGLLCSAPEAAPGACGKGSFPPASAGPPNTAPSSRITEG